MKIVTDYWRKPGPTRNHDWMAVDEDTYDGADDAKHPANAIGFGATEDEAVADLKAILAE